MSRTCTVCNHPQAQDIDFELAAGRSSRALASAYGLGPEAVKRHARNHAPQPAPITDEPTGADPLDELAASLRTRALAGSDAAAREYRLALAALEDRGNVRPEYNVLEDPEWIRIRTLMLDTLSAYPEAKYAVADALRDARPTSASR